jgi:hypothetical protein
MLSAKRTWLALALFVLLGLPHAWAGSTLHIGPGAGTPCATGCGGHPNLFVGALKVDVFQNSGGASALLQPVLVILGVPSQYGNRLPLMPIKGVRAINPYPGGAVTPGTASFALAGTYGLIAPISDGFFGTLWAGQEVYSFLGLPDANNSNSFTNWAEGVEEYVGIPVTGFDIHVYAVDAALGAKGLIDLKLEQRVPKGTYIIAYGQDGDGKAYAVPFTESGLKVGYAEN